MGQDVQYLVQTSYSFYVSTVQYYYYTIYSSLETRHNELICCTVNSLQDSCSVLYIRWPCVIWYITNSLRGQLRSVRGRLGRWDVSGTLPWCFMLRGETIIAGEREQIQEARSITGYTEGSHIR